MTTARADLVTLASAIDQDGETMPMITAFGPGVTLAGVAGDAELLAASGQVRRVVVQAVGGAIWVAFGAAPDAGVEPRGLVQDGGFAAIQLQAGDSIRVAAAALS